MAGWSVTGNNDYIAFGGEFPRVNGVDQQGLVRFARRGTTLLINSPYPAEEVFEEVADGERGGNHRGVRHSYIIPK